MWCMWPIGPPPDGHGNAAAKRTSFSWRRRPAAVSMPWPAGIAEAAIARGARVELALLHPGQIESGCAAPLG